MNLPSVPSDNLYKFLFFTGILVLAYTLTYIPLRSNELKKNLIELTGERDKISKQYEILQNRETQLVNHHDSINYSEEIKSLSMELALKAIDIKTKSKLLNADNHNLKTFRKQKWAYLIFGMLLTSIGLGKWMVFQNFSDNKLYIDYLKSKESLEVCQSCGMELKYETKKQANKKYCSFCYSDKGFNHPDVSFKEFKRTIKQRKKELKFTWYDTYLLVNLNRLERWKKVFKWHN